MLVRSTSEVYAPHVLLQHPISRRLLALAIAVVPVMLGSFTVRAQSPAEFVPVTDAMLQNPDPAEWLNWRRTLDSWGYSPLDEINTENVHQLQLVWSWQLGQGLSQPTPLVHDGVMYIPNPGSVVHAVDAATGDRLWEYQHQFEASTDDLNAVGMGMRTRSIAIYGDKIYVNTSDAHIVALDARTGEVAWDHTVADYALGYRYTSGPIVAQGRIVSGMTGCQNYKNDVCFISAHDPETGEQLWRTSTIARPGEPGGDTWGDLPLTFRAGGDSWIPGSYDPETNLTYWSTSQAKPWARVSRGTDGNALYTNSVLALDPSSGKLEWFYQFTPGETHDLDDVFESVLIDHGGRRSLFKMGKLGILWEIDRTTGQFVAAHDLGYQNVLDVDPRTGEATYRPEMIPQAGVEMEVCPDLQGVRNWRATAYHPGDAGALHSDPPDLRDGDVHRAREDTGQELLWGYWMAPARRFGAPRQWRLRWSSDRHGHHEWGAPLAPLDADATECGGVDDGGRLGRRCGFRPQSVHPRRRDGRRPIPDTLSCPCPRIPDYVCRRRSTVSGGAGWGRPV